MKQNSFEKNKIKFLLVEDIHQSALDNLYKSGYTNIEFYKGALDIENLKESICNAHFIGIRSRSQLTKHFFDIAKKLIAIGCFCIGTNQVNLKVASNKGIPIFNAPFSNTRSVAELVLGEIILMMRGIPEANVKAHNGIWNKTSKGSFEIRGKKLGIIGYGHIGMQLGILAESLGMYINFYDIEHKLPFGNANQIFSLNEILEISDVITLHVPETTLTKNMIKLKQLLRMKRGALIINASRGNIIDIEALCEILTNKHLSGAAIDVFPIEPVTNHHPFISPLSKFDNVILTPHIGGSTEEAQKNIGIEVSGKLIKYSDNGSTLSAVNFPEVSLPIYDITSSRLLHIHQNYPGILASINQVLTEQGINVLAQYLQTSIHIGYVVIDFNADKQIAQTTIKLIKSIPGTIKVRLLY